MTALTPAVGTVPSYTSPYHSHHVTFTHMVRSEWIKRWSLRSTWWVVGISVAFMALLALLFAVIMSDPNTISAMEQAGGGQGGGMMGGGNMADMLNGAFLVTVGYQFAQLTVAVLGVLSISSEYTTGMIRATLSAAPRRLRLLWAKVIVLVTTTVIISLVGLALSWVITYPILRNVTLSSGRSLLVDFTNGTQLRQLGGSILYLVIIALIAFALGSLIRATAGGIFANVAIIWVIPMILGIIVTFANVDWLNYIYRVLPTEAGQQIVMPTQMPDMLSPWSGIAVMATYAVVLNCLAGIAIRKKDA